MGSDRTSSGASMLVGCPWTAVEEKKRGEKKTVIKRLNELLDIALIGTSGIICSLPCQLSYVLQMSRLAASLITRPSA